MNRTHVEAVREAARIQEIVSEHTLLRRSGAQFVGICPLHNERTPSFFVHPRKQVFKCHGCGCGGDVFEFAKNMLGVTFPDAVTYIATRVGIDVERNLSPTLVARVHRIRAARQKEVAFRTFASSRTRYLSDMERSLYRAAMTASDALRPNVCGEIPSSTVSEKIFWDEIALFHSFEMAVERRALYDTSTLRDLWERKMRDAG